MTSVLGRDALLAIAITGRAAIGLPTEVDLAVDSAEDLAVDAATALEIGSGVTWAGTSAAKTIET